MSQRNVKERSVYVLMPMVTRKGTQRAHGDNSTGLFSSGLYNHGMTLLMEKATERARLYPSTYKKILALARKRRTSVAQIVDEHFARTK